LEVEKLMKLNYCTCSWWIPERY